MKEKETIREGKVRRFRTGVIVEHWVHVLTFAILVATGISQKYFYLDVSRWLILKLGGIDSVRLIHRCAGIVFVVAATSHIFGAALGVILKKRMPTMVITKDDFTDAIRDLRYYLGLENTPALCDRYTYKQKFEYWGILSGVLLMLFTGLILWFPVPVTRLLPGEIIPAAKVLHTNQALVVFLIISIWHVYNAVFSPEVFPLDTSIFTGYLSRERMLREHPEEVEISGSDAREGLVVYEK